ncbi:hypothetical protein BCR43DRAFT_32084 [Syncephalastrum racemosum]|uniref:Uncharacterized protein n=1 Tax=Syncephalastrum racemosum TaxID=13706 RepID=A0A1X2HV91_SYNRA|nr:hypothetical protein BCR43DRAFT_32084 [Syncephalastrum racemosum]
MHVCKYVCGYGVLSKCYVYRSMCVHMFIMSTVEFESVTRSQVMVCLMSCRTQPFFSLPVRFFFGGDFLSWFFLVLFCGFRLNDLFERQSGAIVQTVR